MALHKLHYCRIVVSHIGLIEVDKLRKGEEEGFGHLVISLDILENRRKNSYLELGNGVERYGREEVLYVGVAEALKNAAGIAEKLVARKIEGGNDLVKHALSDMLAHSLIVDTALYGIKAREKSVRNERGMRTVKYSYLSRAVHFKLIGSDDNVEVCLRERKLAVKVKVGLYYPEVEELRGVDHIILVAEIKLLTLGITGVDTVNESIGKDVLLVYPTLEILTERPKVGILKNTLLKIITVSVYKLTGKENKSGKAKDLGGASVILSSAENTMPDSVVLETTNLISGCSARARYAAKSS